MGCNLISCCHKCKVKLHHFRGEESDVILPFYYKHKECARENVANVQTIMDNNGNDEIWMTDERHGGYADDSLQRSASEPPKILKSLY